MKKNLSLVLISIFVVQQSVKAQLPVSTSPQTKKVVLEQFTGMWCSSCSGGDMAADQVANANPGSVFIVDIHESTGYEDPNSILNPNLTLLPPAPDFKTSAGAVIYALPNMGIQGFPCASINRAILSGTTITTFQNNYSAFSGSVLVQPAYVNVALQGTLNVQTRVLNVDVQVYYTGNSPASTNSLTVMLLENNISGPQKDGWIGGTTYPARWNPDGTYRHDHILRNTLTPTLGITIPTTTAGSSFSTSLSYTVPMTYGNGVNATPCLLGRLEMIAFVSETGVNIINAAKGPIALTNFANASDVATIEFDTDKEVCEGKMASRFKFVNYGSSTVTSAVFSHKVNNNAVVNYTYSGPAISPYTQSETIFLPTYTFAPVASNASTLDVITINGGSDQNNVNNVSVKSAVPQTTNNTANLNMQMDFTQDMYGYESVWTVLDEASGATVSTGGPYSNLGNGTLLHSSSFTVQPNKCYKLVITDYKKDGINNFAGAGNYDLKANNTSFITSNGKYGKGETRWFSTTQPSGNNELSINDVLTRLDVYPNPSHDNARLAFTLAQNESLNIEVVNAIGQVIYSGKHQLEAGEHEEELKCGSWSSGLYQVNVSSSLGCRAIKFVKE